VCCEVRAFKLGDRRTNCTSAPCRPPHHRPPIALHANAPEAPRLARLPPLLAVSHAADALKVALVEDSIVERKQSRALERRQSWAQQVIFKRVLFEDDEGGLERSTWSARRRSAHAWPCCPDQRDRMHNTACRAQQPHLLGSCACR